MKFYSKFANAFYDDTISTVMPPDSKAITDEQWQSALDGQAQGKTITSDANGLPVAVVAAPTLEQTQAIQIAKMYSAYAGATAQSVTFTTAGGVTKAFQADLQAMNNAQGVLAAYKAALPTDFYWVSADNTRVPFTLADLQGLAKAIGNQRWIAFQNLQNQKASINAGTTVSAARAGFFKHGVD